MSIFEIILTLAISLGAVIWGVNIYNQKGTWFLAGWNTKQSVICLEDALCYVGWAHFYCCMAVLITMTSFYVLDLE